MDAFDADVLIYAAAPDHPLGQRVARLLEATPAGLAGLGSVLLLPELLTKPFRMGATDEVRELVRILARLQLVAADESIARLATSLGSAYRLRAIDALHVATAVASGATRFITNNRKDFSPLIQEIEVVYPDRLPPGV